jgi:hypothetical protein
MSPAAKTNSFRFSDALLARIDAYAAQIAQEAGVRVTRAQAAAKLLTMALEQVERTKRKK